MSKLLQFANFQELINWSVKTNLSSLIESKYKVVTLGNHIIEQKDRVKPFDFPEDDFKILGVSNKVGLFDNEIKKGKEINQAYKIVKNGYLAYNPYRINVGSIGIKTDEHKYDLISPAYVVFSCKETLLPEFLFLIFKTQTFNTIINESTRGSVRQILAFDILETLKIPLPSIEQQKEIVNKYHEKLNLSKEQEIEATKKESNIETYLVKKLELNVPKTENNNDLLQFVKFKGLREWSFPFATKNREIFKSKYPIIKISDICDISSGGTPSREKPEYYTGNIPWIKTTEVRNNHITDTSEKITQDAMKDKNLKLYPKNSLIMAMYGQGLTRGRISKLEIEATTNQACAVFTNFTNTINIDYLWFYLQNEYNRIRELSSGNNQPNLNAQKIKDYPLVLPPINIQNEIADEIKSFKNEIKSLNQQSEQNKNLAIQDFEREIFNEA